MAEPEGAPEEIDCPHGEDEPDELVAFVAGEEAEPVAVEDEGEDDGGEEVVAEGGASNGGEQEADGAEDAGFADDHDEADVGSGDEEAAEVGGGGDVAHEFGDGEVGGGPFGCGPVVERGSDEEAGGGEGGVEGIAAGGIEHAGFGEAHAEDEHAEHIEEQELEEHDELELGGLAGAEFEIVDPSAAMFLNFLLDFFLRGTKEFLKGVPFLGGGFLFGGGLAAGGDDFVVLFGVGLHFAHGEHASDALEGVEGDDDAGGDDERFGARFA